MNCEKFERYIVDYLNGEIEDKIKEKLYAHLKRCDTCKSNLSDYKMLIDNIEKPQSPTWDNEFWDKQFLQISNIKKEKHFKLIPAFTVVILIFSVIAFFFSSSPRFNRISTEKKKNPLVFNILPMSEDRLLEMADYIDEKSASEILDIIFENDNSCVICLSN